jgi:hypothetical protein
MVDDDEKPLYVCVSTAALIGASSLPWIDTAQAQRRSFETPHALDGVYAVDITTQQGLRYHRLITVAGGHVTSAGDTPMEASGQINRRGIVDLAFRRMDKVARVTGRLADGSGSGTWSLPSLQCAWFLARHPAWAEVTWRAEVRPDFSRFPSHMNAFQP